MNISPPLILIASFHSTDTNGVLERQLFDMDRKYTDLKTHLQQLRKQYASTMATSQQQQQQQRHNRDSTHTRQGLGGSGLDGRQGLGTEGSSELCLGSPAERSVAQKRQFSFSSQPSEHHFEGVGVDGEGTGSHSHDDLCLDDQGLDVNESATMSGGNNHRRGSNSRPRSANAAVLSVNTTHGTISALCSTSLYYIIDIVYRRILTANPYANP